MNLFEIKTSITSTIAVRLLFQKSINVSKPSLLEYAIRLRDRLEITHYDGQPRLMSSNYSCEPLSYRKRPVLQLDR